MEKIVTEFTIREVEEDGMCRVQYIAKDALIEGKAYPHNKWGHPYFSNMVSDVLDYIVSDKNSSKKYTIREG